MGQMITKFQADDGQVFDTQAEMDAHEGEAYGRRVESWISAVGDWPRGEAARARRLVVGFLCFERGDAPATPVLTTDD
jgi:hypothetical protein